MSTSTPAFTTGAIATNLATNKTSSKNITIIIISVLVFIFLLIIIIAVASKKKKSGTSKKGNTPP